MMNSMTYTKLKEKSIREEKEFNKKV